MLKKFYCETDGPNWTDNTNWGSLGALDTWNGVTVDDQGKVIGLDLSNNMLSGSIPPELGNLTNLDVLSLNNNELSGSIPPELGNLTNLGALSLGNNMLTGSIPPELGKLTGLFYLGLHNNMLTGSIPPELGSLSRLVELYFNNNMLTGSMPPELGNFPLLDELYLNNNMLSGSIPPELGSLGGVVNLDLSNNMLSGSIPPELFARSGLRLWDLAVLDLSNNMLSGSIPPELGMRPDLTVLDLSDNELSGEIPEELGDLTNLEELHLNNNELSGEIPEELGDLTNLEELSLWSNQELMIQTQDISLLRNQDRAALRIIYNANNGAQWRNNNNWLSTEPLGDWYGVTVNDDGLVTGLDLRSNNLREPVDGAFSGLPSLETLILSGNRALTGELPLGLMDLSDLMTLNVRCTGVGIPDNEDFRTWLAGIAFTSSYCPPPPPPESDCEGLQEDRGEDGLAISPGCVGTSLIVIGSEEGEYITIELSVAGNEEPEEVPSIILSSSLLERVETVSFDLRIPSEEELPEGLRLGGFAAEAGIGNSMLEEGETVTVCLPAPYFEDDEESMPRLYRYEEGWNPLSRSGIETVNGKRSVCADVSSLPLLFRVFVEIPEAAVMEESDGGCSIASGETGRSGSFNVAFNLFFIMFGLVGAFRRRWQICVHRAR